MVKITEDQVYECLYRSKFRTLNQVLDDVKKKLSLENISFSQVTLHLERLVDNKMVIAKTVPRGEDPAEFDVDSLESYLEQYSGKKEKIQLRRYYKRSPDEGKGRRVEEPQGKLEETVVYA